MSMYINSIIANYLSKNSNADVSDIASRLHDLASSNSFDLIEYNSIFDYGNTADETELLNYFSEACNQDADQISDDIGLLFDILDQDGNGSLSDDELEIFERENGRSRGKIDGFGFFNNLINVKESEINEALDELESAKSTSSSNTTTSVKTSNTTSSSKTTETNTGYSKDERIKTDSSGNQYVLVETWESNNSSLNSCLYYIIKHSYNFDELGVSYSNAKEQLLSAIVDENNISNANLVYTNQKIILPDAYEVLGLNNS